MHSLDITHDNSRRISRILEIVKDYRKGIEIWRIAMKYGVSQGYVGKLRKRFDLAKRRPGLIPEVRAAVVEAYAKGVPTKEIVQRYGVDRKTIWVLVQEANIPKRRVRNEHQTKL